ncbi:alpha/beta fold hydrolase [Pelobacter seleniigenes]|uniref:alpha/beta fold hydrolase n=1 Tax=Pelobacter seleniigenes TaxID=407188 RepID=UPI0004A708B1|nr:alpha/beta hydrolase [Pelobacter seleniigenes]
MKKITVREYDFFYVEEGSGPTVVFIHGSALDMRYWKDTIASLSETHRCIALSRRFHWPLPNTTLDGTYRALDQAEDVIAFLEKIGRGPINLIGHSYGGYLAARVASLRPDLVTSLVLMEPGGSIEGQGPVQSLAPKQNAALKMLMDGKMRDGVACYLDSVCGEPKWEDRSPELKSISLANAQSLILQMQDKERPPLSVALLSAISAPTLVLAGALSLSPFPTVARRAAELIPNARFQEIPKAAHLVNIDNLEAFLEAITTFLN